MAKRKLSHRAEQLRQIMAKHFSEEPQNRAAKELVRFGFTERDFAEAARELTLCPEPIILSTRNALRDLLSGRMPHRDTARTYDGREI